MPVSLQRVLSIASLWLHDTQLIPIGAGQRHSAAPLVFLLNSQYPSLDACPTSVSLGKLARVAWVAWMDGALATTPGTAENKHRTGRYRSPGSPSVRMVPQSTVPKSLRCCAAVRRVHRTLLSLCLKGPSDASAPASGLPNRQFTWCARDFFGDLRTDFTSVNNTFGIPLHILASKGDRETARSAPGDASLAGIRTLSTSCRGGKTGQSNCRGYRLQAKALKQSLAGLVSLFFGASLGATWSAPPPMRPRKRFTNYYTADALG